MQQLCFISTLAASMYPSAQGCHTAGYRDTKLLLSNWQLKQTKIRAVDGKHGKRMSKIKCYFHRTVSLCSPFPPISDVSENGKSVVIIEQQRVGLRKRGAGTAQRTFPKLICF